MTQKLVIEIDTAHSFFHGRQSPGVAALLEDLAIHFRRQGVQLTKYPCSESIEERPVYRMDLIETEGGDEWESCFPAVQVTCTLNAAVEAVAGDLSDAEQAYVRGELEHVGSDDLQRLIAMEPVVQFLRRAAKMAVEA